MKKKKFDLKKWRLARGFTQKELAIEMECSDDTIQEIEKGRNVRVADAETWCFRYDKENAIK